MPLITRMLKEVAVYWPPLTNAGPDGQPRYEAGYEVKCRWEDVIEQFTDYKGRTTTSRARVYVGEDLVCGGFLWHGELQDLTAPTNPFGNPGAFEILAFGKLPNLRAKLYLRSVML